MTSKQQQVKTAEARVSERSPLRILERGYSIAYDSKGNVLRSAEQVALGEDISVRLTRGELGATVRTKKNS